MLATATLLAALSSCTTSVPNGDAQQPSQDLAAPNGGTEETNGRVQDPRSDEETDTNCHTSDGELAAFGSRLVELRLGESRSFELCVLVANTATLRAQGLMDIANIEPFDGMLFTFEQTSSSAFWMKNTPLALVVAWFDTDGTLVDVAAMEPCVDQPHCPQYFARAPYYYALELAQDTAVASELRSAVEDERVVPWQLIMSQG